MKIQKTILKAFGKFQDAQFDFTDGINIIYGGNEAGKTTLHKFLEGVFFGFFKPYAKNKLYTPDYDKYYPWNASVYSGSIQYESDGKQYIIERGFDKNNEHVKLYESVTGEDVTGLLDYDSIIKLPCANNLLGVNSVMFENTVSISQMGSVTNEALSKEVGEMLVNTTNTMSSDFSYMGSVNALKEKLNKIGTPKQSKSPYGMSVIRLEQLNNEYAEVKSLLEANRQKYIEITELEKELIRAKKERARLLHIRDLEKYIKLIPLKQELSRLKKELERQIKVSEEDYEKYNRLEALSQQTDISIAEANKKLEEKQKELAVIKEQADKAGATLKEDNTDDMLKDKVILDNALSKLVKLKKQRESESYNEFNTEYEDSKKKTKLFSIVMIISSVLTLLSAVGGYLISDIFYYTGGAFLLIALLFGFLWIRGNRNTKELEPTYDKYDTMMSRTVSMELMCRTEIAQLKDKYGSETLAQLKEVLDTAEGYTAHLKQFSNALDKIGAICSELTSDIAKLNERKETINSQMNSLLTSANVMNAEELKGEIEINRDKNVAFAKLEATQNAIKELLGTQSENELKQKATDALNAGIKKEDIVTDSENMAQTINVQMTDIATRIASIKAEVAQSESEKRPLSDIEEDIQRTEAQSEECRKYHVAYEIAISTINSVSKDIHSSFAMRFNKYVSSIMSTVTNGKYDEVKTDENMNIRTFDNETGRLVKVDELSSGTIDQMYFALRIALADMVVQNKTLPIILDDCFLQYDTNRLDNILLMLQKISQERQIILFTCRNNEYEAMDRLAIPYNLIKIQ